MQQRTRFKIFKRDNFRCQYCGRTSDETVLEVDHITPRSVGGTDDLNNLITSCRECNRGKSNIEILSSYESIENAIYKELSDVGSRKATVNSKIHALETELLNLYLENKDLELKEQDLSMQVMKNKRDNWRQEHIDTIEDTHGMTPHEVKEQLSMAIVKKDAKKEMKNNIVLLFDLFSGNLKHSKF